MRRGRRAGPGPGPIGRRRIASLGTYDVERYLRRLKEAGLSERSVRQVWAVLHRACRLARQWSGGSLPNPVTEAKLPAWSLAEQGEEVRASSADDVHRLLVAAREEGDLRLLVSVRLVAAADTRRGKVRAPSWDDVGRTAGRSGWTLCVRLW